MRSLVSGTWSAMILAVSVLAQTPEDEDDSQPVVTPFVCLHRFDGAWSVEAQFPCDCFEIAVYVAPCPPAGGGPTFIGSIPTFASVLAYGFANGSMPLRIPDDPALIGAVSLQFTAVCIGASNPCPPQST
jgi:hypothetical protein